MSRYIRLFDPNNSFFFPTNQKIILLLFCVTFLSFGTSLFNDFVGDDHYKIKHSSFFRSWKNASYLFKDEFITNSRELMTSYGTILSSGEVSYRPVSALSYFLDYSLWKENPFGYHLHNIFLHFINSVLVFFLTFLILKQKHLATFSSLIFCAHPIVAEPICMISGRNDLYATMFLLISFLSFVSYGRYKGAKRTVVYLLSLVTYLLAVFSKESAIVLPGLVMAYDFCFREERSKKNVRQKIFSYLPFIIVMIFFLYIYTFVFPNLTLTIERTLGADIATYVLTLFYIFFIYVFNMIYPFMIKIIPGFYAPSINGVLHAFMACSGIVLFAAFLYFILIKRSTKTSFFLSWFLIAYIPVSNVIVLVSPMGYRFMYLPSIGLFIVYAAVLDKLFTYLNYKFQIPNLNRICTMGFIISLIIMSVPFNFIWRNNRSVGLAIVRNYPKEHHGYSLAGVEFFKEGDFNNAKIFLKRSLSLGSKNPLDYFMLALSSLDEPQKGEFYLKEVIDLYPEYVHAYIGLGRLYFFQQRYQKAIFYLRKSVNILPTYTAYAYLIQSHLGLNDSDKAFDYYYKAKSVLSEKNQIQSLKKLIDQKDKIPIDVGI